jgi:hypothetical protein
MVYPLFLNTFGHFLVKNQKKNTKFENKNFNPLRIFAIGLTRARSVHRLSHPKEKKSRKFFIYR